MSDVRDFKKLEETVHPHQPIYMDKYGTVRFKRNKIVDYLISGKVKQGIDLNDLAIMDFPREDWEQLGQLIGYSVSGWGGLSYVSPINCAACDSMVENPTEDPKDIQIRELTNTVNNLKKALQEPIADLFGIHPDSLRV